MVTDGDTINVGGQRIRLWGIDAFELAQSCNDNEGRTYPCGVQASNHLGRIIGGNRVTCSPRDRDRYGRIVAVCRVGAVDLSAVMVSLGWAVAYRRYSLDYAPDEDLARETRAGAWSGTFVMPDGSRSLSGTQR